MRDDEPIKKPVGLGFVSARAFRGRLPFDEAAWARGRGWAIWKAMIVLVRALRDDPEDAARTTGVIEAIMADHLATA